MKIWTFEGGENRNFTYLVSDGESREVAIVDAAVDVSQIIPTVESQGLSPTYLLLTHTHHDHIMYKNGYMSLFPGIKMFMFGWSQRIPNAEILRDGDTIKVGRVSIVVIHTPGHYPESVCYLANGALFTGDTLFVGRTGRTVSVGGNTRVLYRSVYNKILTLREDTAIFPGHNYGDQPTITIAENRKISPLLQARDEDDFVKRMVEYEKSRRGLTKPGRY